MILKGILLALLCLTPSLLGAEEGPVRRDHTTVQLVSEVSAFAPGVPFNVGIFFELDEHWHIYWRNPGDAGLAPKFEWELPAGFEISELQWPYPKRIMVSDLANYGYEHKVLLLATVTPPAVLTGPEEVTFSVQADWLVCEEECIPGEAYLSVTIPVREQGFIPDSRWADIFNQTRENIPIIRSDWSFEAGLDTETIYIKGTAPSGSQSLAQQVQFFPYQEQVFNYSLEQNLQTGSNGFILEIPLNNMRPGNPSEISGILVSDNGWRGADSEKAIEIQLTVSNEKPATAGTQDLLLYLLFAFVGGIILNLMPCVLPVLSLKVLGLIGQAGENPRKILFHGLLFAVGVLVSFWLLAGLLMGLRAGGEQLGWGFQLQSPAFVFILSAFLFMLGLSLFGVFEIGISLTGLGTRAQGPANKTGSILSGIMATVVATPCTAPFMGSALGFALTQPAYVSMLIFTFLALGMAAPYVLLTAFPKLLKYIPKPGSWMESLKQFMGFLMMATVIWLIWVLGLQRGTNSVISLLIVLLFLGLGAWILGRWATMQQKAPVRRIAIVLAMTLIVGSVFVGFRGIEDTHTADKQLTIRWEDYSQGEVERRREAGLPVFIDFTAAWCLSCKVNERVALSDEQVVQKINDLNISTFKADWTSRDADITQALAKYGRNSVPLYVLYTPNSEEAVILPEIITPGIVLEALQQINTQDEG